MIGYKLLWNRLRFAVVDLWRWPKNILVEGRVRFCCGKRMSLEKLGVTLNWVYGPRIAGMMLSADKDGPLWKRL